MFKLNLDKVPHLQECQRKYHEFRSLALEGIIDKEDIDKIHNQISKRPFSKDQYVPEGKVLGDLYKIEVTNKLKFFLDRFVTDELIEVLENITGKHKIVPHQLDLYSQESSQNHYLSWHTDKEEDDITNLAVCLPVSHESDFKGAEFQLRDRHSKRMINTIQPKRGDIYLFDIDHDLEHRTSPISQGRRISLTYFFKTGGRRFLPDDQ